MRRTKGEILSVAKVTRLRCMSSSLLQNKDNKTRLLQHVRINGLNRSDPA